MTKLPHRSGRHARGLDPALDDPGRGDHLGPDQHVLDVAVDVFLHAGGPGCHPPAQRAELVRVRAVACANLEPKLDTHTTESTPISTKSIEQPDDDHATRHRGDGVSGSERSNVGPNDEP